MANIDEKIRNSVPPGTIDIENIDEYDKAVTDSVDAIETEINEDRNRINTLISKYQETIATHHFMGSEYPQTNKEGSVFFIFKNENTITDNQEIEGES